MHFGSRYEPFSSILNTFFFFFFTLCLSLWTSHHILKFKLNFLYMSCFSAVMQQKCDITASQCAFPPLLWCRGSKGEGTVCVRVCVCVCDEKERYATIKCGNI